MEKRNLSSLRAMLEKMPTDQLDEMLNAELTREPVDADAVKLIFRILKERDKLHVNRETSPNRARNPNGRRNVSAAGWAARVASIAAALVLVFALIPREVQAENLIRMLSNWTDKFLEFLSPEGPDSYFATYAYATENEDLQLVYDDAVEEDILLPSVPMWIPEGYALEACQVEETSRLVTLKARFGEDGKLLTLEVQRHESLVTYQPQGQVAVHERHGVSHFVFREDDRWVAVWANENVLCTLTADCDEKTFLKILDSVYSPDGM